MKPRVLVFPLPYGELRLGLFESLWSSSASIDRIMSNEPSNPLRKREHLFFPIIFINPNYEIYPIAVFMYTVMEVAHCVCVISWPASAVGNVVFDFLVSQDGTHAEVDRTVRSFAKHFPLTHLHFDYNVGRGADRRRHSGPDPLL